MRRLLLLCLCAVSLNAQFQPPSGGSGGGGLAAMNGTFASLPACSSTVNGGTYSFTNSYYSYATCKVPTLPASPFWSYFAPQAGKVSLPPTTGWSYVNQSSASFEATAGPVVWSLPTSGGSARFILRTPTYTAPPWSYIVGITYYAANSNFYDGGLLVRASGSGNFIGVALATSFIRFFNVGGSVDATGPGIYNSGGGVPVRFKITNDGTTVSAYISYTNQAANWVLVGTDTNTNLGTIDGVGLLAYKIGNTSGPANLDQLMLWDFQEFNSVI